MASRRAMTARDLIAALEDFDPDMEVIAPHELSDGFRIVDIEVLPPNRRFKRDEPQIALQLERWRPVTVTQSS